jgi:hypothetical protein
MNDYSHVRNILACVFSVQTGLDDVAAQSAYQRALDFNPALKAEVQKALADADVSWKELLFNDEYEVYEAESERDAKTFACRLLKQNTLQ